MAGASGEGAGEFSVGSEQPLRPISTLIRGFRPLAIGVCSPVPSSLFRWSPLVTLWSKVVDMAWDSSFAHGSISSSLIATADDDCHR
jgi:hypothetical protein